MRAEHLFQAERAGGRVWIWRAVDNEGEVMDMIVHKRRDTVALRFLRRLFENQDVEPEVIVPMDCGCTEPRYTVLV